MNQLSVATKVKDKNHFSNSKMKTTNEVLFGDVPKGPNTGNLVGMGVLFGL
jgi:hypothetical protein